MDKKTKGAWVVHHGRKLALDLRGASEYSAIDVASKAATLLSRLAASNEAVVSRERVIATAKVGCLNPKTELEVCLNQLKSRRLIDVGSGGDVSVLGITGHTALSHAAGLLDDNDPQPQEMAVIELAEHTSTSPLEVSEVAEYIGDKYKFAAADSLELVQQASQIGFVDAEGEGKDRLLFNGHLFRRDNAVKTKKVLDSLSTAKQLMMQEFDAILQIRGATTNIEASKILGDELFSKLKAAAIYDMNIVSNEAGDHVLITAPGSFHKFTDPMVDDAFDHAKALVAALSYGMMLSSTYRGQIWGVDLLLKKLLRGGEVGPASAIGHDYKALELEGVVQIISRKPGSFTMKLLKKEVGQIALQVLQGGNASAKALETLPGAGMRSYTAPEAARSNFRKTQVAASKAQTRTLLSAVRGGHSL